MTSSRKFEREFVQGLGRSVKRAERKPGWIARLGTNGPLNRLCRAQPQTVRETVQELALMRAGWQRISYRRALRQIIKAALSGGSSIDVPPGI